jgi:hypothetical protein
LSWQPPKQDGGSPITKYLVEKCDTKKMSWSPVAEVDANTLSQTVGKLIENQPYLFRVSAINAEGQSKPLVTDAEIKPKKPAGLYYINFRFYKMSNLLMLQSVTIGHTQL